MDQLYDTQYRSVSLIYGKWLLSNFSKPLKLRFDVIHDLVPDELQMNAVRAAFYSNRRRIFLLEQPPPPINKDNLFSELLHIIAIFTNGRLHQVQLGALTLDAYLLHASERISND